MPLYVSSSAVSGVTLDRKWMYSSVWNDVMVSGVERSALYGGFELLTWEKERGILERPFCPTCRMR